MGGAVIAANARSLERPIEPMTRSIAVPAAESSRPLPLDPSAKLSTKEERKEAKQEKRSSR